MPYEFLIYHGKMLAFFICFPYINPAPSNMAFVTCFSVTGFDMI